VQRAEVEPEAVAMQRGGEGTPSARQKASISARSTSEVPNCASSGGILCAAPHAACAA
jgi:hypothetical protein